MSGEILGPQQLDFVRAFRIDAVVNGTEHTAAACIEPAGCDIDVLRLNSQLTAASGKRPDLGCLEERCAYALPTIRRKDTYIPNDRDV